MRTIMNGLSNSTEYRNGMPNGKIILFIVECEQEIKFKISHTSYSSGSELVLPEF